MSEGTGQGTPRQGGRPRRNPLISRRIGANIRRAREAKGFTQAHLAQLIGEQFGGAQNVSRWERGIARPDDEKLELLADALSLPSMTVFFEIHEPEGEAA